MIKRNFLKKFLAVTLAGTMLFSLIGCGAENKDESNNVSDNKVEDSKVEDSKVEDNEVEEAANPFGPYEDTVKITAAIAGQNAEVTTPDNGDHFEKNAVKSYVEEMLNIEVEAIIQTFDAGDYSTQISLGITSGELPDIFMASYEQFLELAENDMLADLTDVWEQYVDPRVKALYDEAADFGVDVLEKGTYDGKLLSIPRLSVDQPGDWVFVREDWLEALDIKVDEDGDKLITREELEMVAKAFIDEEPGGAGETVGITCFTGMSTLDGGPSTVNSSFHAFHRYYMRNEDGSIYAGSTSPEGKEAVAWWREMYEKGILDPQFGTRDWGGVVELATNQQLGILMFEFSSPNWLFTSVYDACPTAKFACYGLDDGTGQSVQAQFPTVNRWFCVSKDCENPEVAIKMLNIQMGLVNWYDEMPNTNDILTQYHDELIIPFFDLTGLSNVPAGLFQTAYKEAKACMNGEITEEEITSAYAGLVMDLINKYETSGYESMSTADKGNYNVFVTATETLIQLQETGKLYIQPTLIIPTTKTIETRKGDLDKMEDETWVKIITGEEPVDFYDEFVKEYNEYAGNAIIEELEAALK